MPVTRDPNYPENCAQLFQAFSRCADGYGMHEVVDVAAHFLVAALVAHRKARGDGLEMAVHSARALSEAIVEGVEKQFNRLPRADDILVRMN